MREGGAVKAFVASIITERTATVMKEVISFVNRSKRDVRKTIVLYLRTITEF